jgi:hypothetical protein
MATAGNRGRLPARNPICVAPTISDLRGVSVIMPVAMPVNPMRIISIVVMVRVMAAVIVVYAFQ